MNGINKNLDSITLCEKFAISPQQTQFVNFLFMKVASFRIHIKIISFHCARQSSTPDHRLSPPNAGKKSRNIIRHPQRIIAQLNIELLMGISEELEKFCC